MDSGLSHLNRISIVINTGFTTGYISGAAISMALRTECTLKPKRHCPWVDGVVEWHIYWLFPRKHQLLN
ncbi:hypothetical protein BDW59DRAFT_140844 [Aspergillus cavernicola]|uniref:Uncharacterized protein n=1 Tax=Aspergillus cavernicola TaxID=176166 RepID=A0ABR4IST5_9EURO